MVGLVLEKKNIFSWMNIFYLYRINEKEIQHISIVHIEQFVYNMNYSYSIFILSKGIHNGAEDAKDDASFAP